MSFLNKYSLKQQMNLISLLIGVLISLTFFLPVVTYFKFNKMETAVLEDRVYGFETISVFVHFYCFICILLAAFTFNKLILRINNIVIWIFFSLKFLFDILFSNPYAVHGPVAPKTEIGYVLSFLLVITFLIVTSFWRRKFDSMEVHRNQTIVLGGVWGTLLIIPILWFILEVFIIGL